MEIVDSVLIVEDEDDWSGIYERAARRRRIGTIKIAKNLRQAEMLLDAMRFAVAFVDIGLDVGDDRNIDGLRVMAKIRALDDPTSIIVITGRSGRDVLPITRDAIKKYDAFDTVGKVPIDPGDITDLLTSGLAAYRKEVGANPPRVNEVLQGGLAGWEWDDQILRATRITGGVATLYGFLDRLFARFLPVVTRRGSAHVRLDSTNGVAYGDYWSRAIGKGVVICFGNESPVETVAQAVRSGRPLLDKYDVGEILNESSAGGVRGIVYELNSASRHSFGATEGEC